MEAMIIHPKNEEQATLFEQLAKALKVPFEKKEGKDSYSPEFVDMIKKAEKRAKYKSIEANDIWGSLNLK